MEVLLVHLFGLKGVECKNDLERLLIDDMGGQGRALEVLSEVLKENPDSSYVTILIEVRSGLQLRYLNSRATYAKSEVP